MLFGTHAQKTPDGSQLRWLTRAGELRQAWRQNLLSLFSWPVVSERAGRGIEPLANAGCRQQRENRGSGMRLAGWGSAGHRGPAGM